MRIAAALLLLASFAAPVVSNSALADTLILQIGQVEKYGCKVDEQGPYWRTTVWADYKGEPSFSDDVGIGNAGHSYAKVYAMRESRRKALNDCDDWMSKLTKAIAKQKADRK